MKPELQANCTDCAALGATRQWPDSPPLCPTCAGVRKILNTSAEEACRYEIPHATQPVLLAARARIGKDGLGKVTLVNAIERQLRKLAKARA